MGVHGLWPLLHPVARPVALETMGGKKLAIDSSIWLYQFQIAMRDKEGRALDNAHILGFLRRICKLLFYGIKPVFVFDGGAPLIKKVAISNRKNRKKGAKETAAKTAEKLLAAQLRAAAVAQAQKTALERETGDIVDQDNANYLDEDYGVAPRGAPERRSRRGAPVADDTTASMAPANGDRVGSYDTTTTPPTKKKQKYVHKDQYALPAIDGSLQSKALPADHRLATEDELRSFIEDMRPEDFDMDSEFFANLPVEVKYEIIGDLRIKSRQVNMKRVEAMKNAPTALDFSKAQILNLSHRNDLTQKLLHVTDSLSRTMATVPVRIAGERNKEYVLIKNETGAGAGYILGIKDEGRTQSSPVKIDATTTEESDTDKTTTDEEFEPVEIPKVTALRSSSPDQAHRKEMTLQAIKQRYSPVKAKRKKGDDDDVDTDDEDFVPVQTDLSTQRPLFATTGPAAVETSTNATSLPADLFAEIQSAVRTADEEEDLQRALEASRTDVLEQNGADAGADADADADDNDSDVFFDEVVPSPTVRMIPVSSKLASTNLNEDPSKQSNVDVDSDASVEYVDVTVPVYRKPMEQRQDPEKSRENGSSVPIGLSSSDEQPPQSSLKARRGTPNLHIDVPAAREAPPPSSPPGYTPRPDLTKQQAERDTSPTLVASHDGVIERDYAPQPAHIPQKQTPGSPRPVAALESDSRKDQDRAYTASMRSSRLDEPAREMPSLVQKVSPAPSNPIKHAQPSLMSRTLSTNSHRSPSPPDTIPAISDAIPSQIDLGSEADRLAVHDGPVSVLQEGRATPAPSAAVELDKGQLQQEVVDGDVNRMAGAAVHQQQEETGGRAVEGDTRADSPEIFYDWSPSPEPVARKRPKDATLLPPEDPNYIPPEIDFGNAEEDLEDHHEDDDVEHVENLTSEQKEYAKFLSELKNKDLAEMEFEVQNELRVLNEQNKKDRAMADDITQQMAKDIQTMLRVLGLPYVVAPMEAEAQCAELLARDLVDGVITDDNDVFLFGASRVYKNMFNQNKYVECYLASDIDRELALNREKLIRLAYFLGSDYCDGLPGVGPVLGMELMAEFPGPQGLVDFRNWWLKVQRGRDTPADHPTAFRRKFKKSKKDLFIDDSWPNPEVAKAYLHPTVDESDEAFAWGIPDLDALRDFLKDHLGWGNAKVDELMLPIIKRMTGRAAGSALNQSTISNFFDISGGTGRFAPMANKGYQSKRLQNVVKAWRQSQQQLAAKAEEQGDASGSQSEATADITANVDGEPSGSSTKGKGSNRRRPIGSRRGSSRRTSSSSSRTLSRQNSRAGGHSSSENDDDDDDDDDNFHHELEAKLEKMGVKRKREAPIGSTRIIQPAKRSKKDGGSRPKKPKRTASSRPLFNAPDSEDEDAGANSNKDGRLAETEAAAAESQPKPRKRAPRAMAKKKAKMATTTLDDDDEYRE